MLFYIILDYPILSYIIPCFPWGVTPYFFLRGTPYFFPRGTPYFFLEVTPYFFFRGTPGDRAWAFPDFKFGGNVTP